MIQFKRGSTTTWRKLKTPLADGQPGYDKEKRQLKIGDGKKVWSKLRAIGVSKEEILDSEQNAKIRLKDDPESYAIITYGTKSPDTTTVGELYLQYHDSDPTADYVVDAGVQGIWTYRKWHSGRVECTGIAKITCTLVRECGSLFCDSNIMSHIGYPFKINGEHDMPPIEIATVHGPGGIVWPAVRAQNSNEHSAVYNLVSAIKQQAAANYLLSIRVDGFWK